MHRHIKAVAAVAVVAIFIASAIPVSAATYQGVDIAHYAYSVDFNALKSSGHGQFVYIKTSEGITWRDPKWQQFMAGAKAAGIPYGFYHYFHSDDNGATQAEVFWSLIKDTGYDVVPAIDVEETDGNDAPVIQQQLRAFVDRFYQLSGQKPVIYASTYFINKFIGSGFTDCLLWQADYRGSAASVAGWGSGYTVWQYSGSSKVDGVDNSADLDIAANEDIFIDGKAPSGGSTSSSSGSSTTDQSLTHKVGDQVTFSYCFASSTDAASAAIPASRMSVTHGTITRVLQGTNNPYLLDNGLCWVNDSAISGTSSGSTTTATQSTAHSVGEEVAFTTCYRSSTDPISEAIPASKMSVHTGKITKIIPGRHNPYLLDDGLCWVNDGDISSGSTSSSSSSTDISVGNTVSIRSGAVYGGVWKDRGTSIPAWVLSGTYRVEQIATHDGAREALLSGIDSWVSASKLYRR